MGRREGKYNAATYAIRGIKPSTLKEAKVTAAAWIGDFSSGNNFFWGFCKSIYFVKGFFWSYLFLWFLYSLLMALQSSAFGASSLSWVFVGFVSFQALRRPFI